MADIGAYPLITKAKVGLFIAILYPKKGSYFARPQEMKNKLMFIRT